MMTSKIRCKVDNFEYTNYEFTRQILGMTVHGIETQKFRARLFADPVFSKE